MSRDLSVTVNDLWATVREVVSSRGRKLVKYGYFEEVWEALLSDAGLTIVRAPTGCGKTEASTAPFIHGLAQGERWWLSLVYALPTRSLVAAMRRRLSEAVGAVGAWPCTATINYGGPFVTRPYLEGDVAVTTYDTLLYQFYGIAHPWYRVLLPMSKVACSLVVMDEVQLLQDTMWYSMSLIPAHLAALLSMGAKVVLMSATLPKVLLDSIDHELTRCDVRARLKQVWGEAYRVIDSRDVPARGRLDVELREGPLPSGRDLINLLSELKLGDRLPALIVTNKVSKAVEVYMTLLKAVREGKLRNVAPVLLHSRLRWATRKAVEEMFESKEERRLKRVVLVATQVVEAGLDLDVRLLLTEVSPVDSLIQRLGRCGRRTDGFALVFLDEESGKGVYPSALLRSTISLIRGREDELSNSVRRLDCAQELVDSVYTKEVVDELKRGIETLIERARDWIRKSIERVFAKSGHRTRLPLLRLGAELTCWLPSPDHYHKLLTDGVEECVKVQEFIDNVVRLSLRSPLRPPAAILHRVGSKVGLLVLRVSADRGQGRVTIRCLLYTSPSPRDRG